MSKAVTQVFDIELSVVSRRPGDKSGECFSDEDKVLLSHML